MKIAQATWRQKCLLFWCLFVGTLNSSAFTYETLYTFPPSSGLNSSDSALIQDRNGNFFGTGAGSVFQLTTSFQLISIFGRGATNDLIQGQDGTIYGVSPGTNGQFFGVTGMFSTNQMPTNYIIGFDFQKSMATNGTDPSGLIYSGTHLGYVGTTATGGPLGGGTVFTLTPGIPITNISSYATNFALNQTSPPAYPPNHFFITTYTLNVSNYLAAPPPNNCYLGYWDYVYKLVNGIYVIDKIHAFPGNGFYTNYTYNWIQKYVYASSTSFGLDTYITNLCSFALGDGPFGYAPKGPLAVGPDGSLYGTASLGGVLQHGVVFRIDPNNNNLGVMHTFSGPEGANPEKGLLRASDGFLYGVTSSGGAFGSGTVFKMDYFGAITPLHSFTVSNQMDGASSSRLIEGTNGYLYGTLERGGEFGYGALYKINASGNFSLLHSFNNDTNGCFPRAALMLGPDKSFYGTTSVGFDGNVAKGGTVFRFSDPNAVPIFTQQPHNVSAPAGATVQLQTVATGGNDRALSYWWSTPGEMAFGSTLVLSNVSGYDSGDYYAVARNPFGSATSSIARVTIDDPVIIASPQSTNIQFGNTLQLQVGAVGTTNWSCTWRKDGQVLLTGSSTNLVLPNISGHESGSYDVIISNRWGIKTSEVAQVTVNDPIWLSKPSGQTNAAGSDVVFCASAAGSGIRYQWFDSHRKHFQNNDRISGAQSECLTIHNVTAADADGGGVSVIIGSDFDALHVSESFYGSLLWGAPLVVTEPTITPMGNVVNAAGATVTLSASAFGTAPMTYQWLRGATRNTFVPIIDDARIAGSQTATLTISDLQTSDAMDYAVYVQTARGSNAIGNSVTVTVTNVPPKISIPPVDVTVVQNSSAAFTVLASGTAPFYYQWIFNGTNIPGATASSCLLSNCQSSDVGQYSVIISNIAGVVSSSTATLTVTIPSLSILQQPASRTNDVGTTSVFSVVTDGTTPLSYQWMKTTGNGTDGIAVVDGDIISGATTASLTMADLVHTSEGGYYVVIGNSAGSTNSDIAILGVHEPVITLQPLSVNPNFSNSLSLTVAAIGSPGTTNKYQWYFKSSTALPSAPFAVLVGKTNTTLFVNNALASASGSYCAVVTNLYGKSTSSVASVTVTVAPKIVAQPTVAPKAIVPNGTMVWFTLANVTGTAPRYQWSLNGDPIVGATASRYTNSSATFSDSGVYTVLVSNGAGSVTNTNTLTLIVEQDTNIPTAAILKPVSSSILYETNNPTGAVTACGIASDNARVSSVYLRLNGGAWTPVTTLVPTANGTGAQWTNELYATAGTNILEVKSVDFSGGESKVAKTVFYFHVPSPITITIDEHDTRAAEGFDSIWPPDYRATLATGLVSATNNAPTNGAFLFVNRGPYKLTAIPGHNQMFTNWTRVDDGVTNFFSTNAMITFTMETNLHLVANFVHNPWIEAAGEYNGLFIDAGTKFENSGFISLLVTTNRTFTGKLLIDGDLLPLSGGFNVDGTRDLTVSRAVNGKPNLFVRLIVSLTVYPGSGSTSGTNQITGSVVNGAASASLVADQWVFKGALTNPFYGKYTMIMARGDNAALSPGGYGYGLITVATNAKPFVVGALADSTIFAPEIAPVSLDGRWPVFKQIYTASKLRTVNFTNDQVFHTNASSLGAYIGWMTFTNETTNTIINGALAWIKTTKEPTNLIAGPVGVYANYYPNGFSVLMPVSSFNYAPNSNAVPPAGTNLFGADQRVISVTNAILSFTDGDLPNDLQEQAVQLRTNNTVGIWGYLPVVTSTTYFTTNTVSPFNVTKTIVQTTKDVLQLTTSTTSTNHELAKLSMLIDSKTGKLSGSFTNVISQTDSGAAKPIMWSGAVVQPWNVGFGYFLGTNQSGAVLLHGALNNVPPQ